VFPRIMKNVLSFPPSLLPSLPPSFPPSLPPSLAQADAERRKIMTEATGCGLEAAAEAFGINDPHETGGHCGDIVLSGIRSSIPSPFLSTRLPHVSLSLSCPTSWSPLPTPTSSSPSFFSLLIHLRPSLLYLPCPSPSLHCASFSPPLSSHPTFQLPTPPFNFPLLTFSPSLLSLPTFPQYPLPNSPAL